MPRPAELRSPKYAVLIPAVSAGIVGFVSMQGYEMAGQMRADVMGVTNGLLWFLAERCAWWVGVCLLEREETAYHPPASTPLSGRAIHHDLEHLRQQERSYAAQVDSTPARFESKYSYENAGQLWISQHPKGGNPWLALPVDVTRQHINYFVRTCIEPGTLAPTESNLSELPRDVVIAIRQFSLYSRRQMWAIEKPGGRWGTWELTQTGRVKWQQVQRRLLGLPWYGSPPPGAGVQNGGGRE